LAFEKVMGVRYGGGSQGSETEKQLRERAGLDAGGGSATPTYTYNKVGERLN
jgi:hypothetical protein